MMLGSGGGHRTGWSRSTGSEGCSTASKLSNGGTPWSAAAGLILLLPTLSSCTAPTFIQISPTVLAIPLVSSDIAQLRNFVCRRCTKNSGFQLYLSNCNPRDEESVSSLAMLPREVFSTFDDAFTDNVCLITAPSTEGADTGPSSNSEAFGWRQGLRQG